MTLHTDRGAALPQLGEIFYEGVFQSKYNFKYSREETIVFLLFRAESIQGQKLYEET